MNIPLRILSLALFALSPVHAMRGLVEDSSGTGLPGVEVRASWRESPETTDVFGTWKLDNPVSITSRIARGVSWHAEGLVLDLETPAVASIELFDARGGRLAVLRKTCAAGRTFVPIQESWERAVRFVRVAVDGELVAVLTKSAQQSPVAGRGTGAIHALSFHKDGYQDQLRLVEANQDTVRTVLWKLPVKKVARVEVLPDSGVHFGSWAEVSFRSETDSATFFFTLDGSIPSWDTSTFLPKGSSLRWNPGQTKVQIQRSLWLTAVGTRRGWVPSEVFRGRFVFIGDSSLVEDFEGTGLSGTPGGAGLSWFACQHAGGDGCSQDQFYSQERTTPRLDTLDQSYHRALGRRAWRIQVSMNKHGENLQAAYAGGGIRVPQGYADAAYRLVFWAKWQDTVGSGPTSLPFLVEMATRHNANNNGGYADGFHRRVASLTGDWKMYELGFDEFYAAGNGYSAKLFQPDSTSSVPRSPAEFTGDRSMHSLGLSGWQGKVHHGLFAPSWTWGVSKEMIPRGEDIVAFRFSVMQPMSPEVAATVGPASPSWKDPREQPFMPSHLDALVKGIGGYLWIDEVRMVRRSVF